MHMDNLNDDSINPKYANDAYKFLYDRGVVKNKSDLAFKIGKDRSSVSRAFRGEEGYLNRTFLERFNAKFGNIFNPDYLLNGIGSLLCCNPDEDDEEIFNPGKETIPADVVNDNETGTGKDKQEIQMLKELLKAKDELIASKDNQIRLLEMIIGKENDKKV